MILFESFLSSGSDISSMLVLGGGTFIVLILILLSFDILGDKDQKLQRRIDQIIDPKLEKDLNPHI